MSAQADYELIYHAGIPGRGEFIRLFLEATATPYIDSALVQGQSAVKPYLDGSFEGNDRNPLVFAPPVLKHGRVVISQTPNILLYLSTHVASLIDLSSRSGGDPEPGSSASTDDVSSQSKKKVKVSPQSLTDDDDATVYHVNSLVLTILDLNNEAHDTHHPTAVSAFYEDQKPEAIKKAKAFRTERVPKFFDHLHQVLEKSSGDWLLGDRETAADLCLFQVVDGLRFAFPKLMGQLLPRYPKILAHYDLVKDAPRIKAYLGSERRQKYSMGVFRYYPELDAEDA
ncbi:hypothetical protein JCM10212_003817 [Sporobolomyces blumeae]